MSRYSRPQSRKVIELLAPARDAECARAAIDHGADAVYIGSPQFGARKAAANTLADIESVVGYAHTFGCGHACKHFDTHEVPEGRHHTGRRQGV